MPRQLGFRNCSRGFKSSRKSGALAHPEPNIRGGPALSKIFIAPYRVQIPPKNKRGPGPAPISFSDVVMGNTFFSISYQIMLDCWRENPVDRPTFERLRNTMKEMERNHRVRRIRTFFKREKQSWRRKVHLGKKLIIFQGLKLGGVCSTSLPPSHLNKRLIKRQCP